MLRLAFPVSTKFRKQERLSSEVVIGKLFKSNLTLFVFPFKIFYLPASELSVSDQVVISVSKRSFKRAVDRNLLKRRIREAYRLNKNLLYKDLDAPFFTFALVYVAKKIMPYQEIESKLKLILTELGANKDIS